MGDIHGNLCGLVAVIVSDDVWCVSWFRAWKLASIKEAVRRLLGFALLTPTYAGWSW